MTDKDFEVYASIVPGPDKTETYNKDWIKATKELNRVAKQKSSFFRDFERKYKNLQGAEESWQLYMTANPLFTEGSDAESFKVNKKRQSWKQFFGKGGVGREEAILSVGGGASPKAPAATGKRMVFNPATGRLEPK